MLRVTNLLGNPVHFFRVAFGLAALSVAACSPSAAKTASHSESELSCTLQVAGIQCPGLTLSFPPLRGTMALSELTRGFSAKVGPDGPRVLVLSVAGDTEARTLLQVILSAEQAGFQSVFVVLQEGPMEVATPDSEHLPPFALSDLFVALEGDGIFVGKSAEELGSREAGLELVRITAGRGEFRRNCPTASSCQSTALSASPLARFSEIRQVLEVLQATGSGNRSFRLVLDEGARSVGSTKPSERQDPPFAAGAVRAALEARSAEFKLCHTDGERGVDALGGTLTVDFTITTLGIVFDVTVEPSRSTISDLQIQSCVLELVTKIRFPKPQRTSSTVRHTFRF